MALLSQEHKVYGVILAGGSGERLWPLSRVNKPKQLLSLGSEKTLLEQTIARLRAVPVDELWVTCAKKMVPYLAGYDIDYCVQEPFARNTGPAVLYACFQIMKKDPQAVILFLPADAYIPPEDTHQFAKVTSQLITYAHENECITLLGVPPTYPAMGYGYIAYDMAHGKGPFKIATFHEKPSKERAAAYIQQPNMVWNVGICAAKVSVVIQEFFEHAPTLLEAMSAYLDGRGLYEDIPAVAIDYAIMEKSKNSWVLPASFSWHDVGNLEMFLSLKYPLQKGKLNVLQLRGSNNLVEVPHKLTVLLGVDDICVVETEDALLIAKRSEVEQVRDVVGLLKKNRQVEYL